MDGSNVIIHVRFAPNGTVAEIGERPAGYTPQEWFDYMAEKAADAYQTFAGGRGVFRLAREQVDTLKAAATRSAA